MKAALRRYFSMIGRLGGMKTSPRKRAAVIRNAALATQARLAKGKKA